MKNLVKIGLFRLSKNMIYIVGCILAFVITYWFMTVRPIVQLSKYDPVNVAIILSAAITLFFSVFVGLFIGNDIADGILRNKVMVGHSQLDVYFSNYITFLVALVGIMIFWFAGSVAGGAAISSELMLYMVIAFLYNAAFIAIVQAIVFRLKKQVVGISISMGLFYIFVVSVLMGNFFYMITDTNKALQNIVIVVYNVSALGQCFARSGLADQGLANTGVQISASIIIFILATFIGTLKLKKRDIN